MAFSLVGSILLWQLPIEQTGGRLFAVYILAFYGGGYACLMGLTVANCAGYTKRSVSSSGIFVASRGMGRMWTPSGGTSTHASSSLSADLTVGSKVSA